MFDCCDRPQQGRPNQSDQSERVKSGVLLQLLLLGWSENLQPHGSVRKSQHVSDLQGCAFRL